MALASVLHAVEALIPLTVYRCSGRQTWARQHRGPLYTVETMGLSQALRRLSEDTLGGLLGGTFLNMGYYLSTSEPLLRPWSCTGIPDISGADIRSRGKRVRCIHAQPDQPRGGHRPSQVSGVLFISRIYWSLAVPTGVFVGLLAEGIIRISPERSQNRSGR